MMRMSIKVERESDPEEFALKEYVTQLAAKNMTPEQFFRLCDGTY